MKINSEQLAQYLGKSQQGGFWLASDEVFLQQIAADLVRRHAKQAGFIDRRVFYIDAAFNWDPVFDALQNRSLFNDKQLIELHFLQDKFQDADRKALQACTKCLNEELFLLILSSKIEAQTQKAKWFEEVTQPLYFAPIWPIATQQYSTWIKSRSHHYQLQFTNEALVLLANQTQGNPLAADQILQQLQLIADTKPITKEHITEVTHEAMQTDLFTFADIFLSAPKQALPYLLLLKNQNSEPILVVWALARELRTLNNILLQLAQGQSQQTVFRNFHIWPAKQMLMAQACKHFTVQQIQAAIQQLAQIDLMIKGVIPGCPWVGLERLVLC